MERKKVDSKLLLFTLVLVLIVLFLFNLLLENNNKDEIWDYDNIESVTDIIGYGEEIEDRETYYILESIVVDYLNSYVDTYNEAIKEDKMSYKDYYNYLTSDYKKYLGKNKYDEIADRFLNKFYVYSESDVESMEYMETSQIIKEIYSFENNIYLCKLKNSFNDEVGYIAIKLQSSENSYNFVYIE